MPRLGRDEFRDLLPLLKPAGRRAQGLLLVPGVKCAREYLRAGGVPLLTLLEEGADELLEGLTVPSTSLRRPRGHELARLADQPHPEGLLLVGPPPRPESSGPFHLLFDGVQDPGNLGTMLRTALWFGFDRVGLLAPCADPWSPRGIRASMGAVFHMAACRELDTPPAGRLVGLDAHDGVPLQEFAFQPEDVLVLGSESHGLRLPGATLGARVRIPGAGRLESLNVGQALAICAWERFRRGPR